MYTDFWDFVYLYELNLRSQLTPSSDLNLLPQFERARTPDVDL